MSAELVADRRLHPATVPVKFLKDAPATALGLPAVFGVANDIGIERVLLGMAAIAALVLVGGLIRWLTFRYGVGPDGMVIQSGLLNRSRRVIPIERVQDIDIERGPLQRLFGLARLRIETGAADKDEGALDSVSLAEAERLRALLKGAAGSTGPADEAEPVLFAMTPARVLLFGLFNFSMVWLAGIFAVIQTLGDLFPISLEDLARMLGLAGREALARFSPPVIAAGVLAALVLGVVTGLVQTLAREHGFTLMRTERGLRRRRGLFTRSDVAIPRKRVQLGLLTAGPVARALGYWNLSLQTLGEADDDGGKQPAAPFATLAEIAPVLAATPPLRRPDPAMLQRVSRRYITRSLIRVAPLALIVIGASLIFWPLIFALALPLLMAADAILGRRAHRFALDHGMLFVERGWLKRSQWLVPVPNVQTVSISRSWLQRRLGSATVLADTPGAASFSDPRIVDLAAVDAPALARAILASAQA